MQLKKGYIQVYTGNGKGKTTAAIGAAVRALGAGLKVCFAQFFKHDSRSSEFNVLNKLENFTYYNFCPQYPYWLKCKSEKNRLNAAMRRDCNLALGFIKEIITSKEYDVVIIDELDIALRDGYMAIQDVILALKQKNSKKEIIITGRGSPVELIKYAGLVTEMKEKKHYFSKGVKARKGIEY